MNYILLFSTEVPDIKLMPPTPQHTTLTESGSEMKPASRQPTLSGRDELLEEHEDKESAEEEGINGFSVLLYCTKLFQNCLEWMGVFSCV